MVSLSKLKNSQKKDLIENLSNQYDSNLGELYNFYFYMTGSNKVYISNNEINEIELPRVNSIGLYFGTFHDNERFRLSIEGSKFVNAKKNFVVLKQENLKSYLAAENLFVDEVEKIDCDNSAPFLIVKLDDENLGCVSLKDKMLLNYVSKSRKLDFNKVF